MAEIRLDFSPRDQQKEMLLFTTSAINSGKKFIMIDAPTGVGKSFYAIMLANWYNKQYNKKAKVDILTNTKILQDQYVNDFSFAANLKGNNNYFCGRHKISCGEASLINRANKDHCKICPHRIAKNRFSSSPLSLTNFHLATSYMMYLPEFFVERDSKLLIIDEANLFEETFCDFIASTLSERSLKLMDIWQPWMESDLTRLDTLSAISKYVSGVVVPLIENKIEEHLSNFKNLRGKKKLDAAKKADFIDKIMCKYNRFVEDKDNYSSNWIFEKELDNRGKTTIKVEPIWGNIYLKEQFWDKYDHVVLMSGTILDQELFSFIMGIPNDESTYLSLECPFDAEKRPVIYAKFGKMSYYDKAETFKTAAPLIANILKKNSEHKGIIHTSTYQFSKWIQEQVKSDRLLFHDAATREKTLKKHLVSKKETVLVSPSMINGIDLKDELSRFQIILKVPFPNLMSKRIKRRLETKPEWYNWKALADLLQAYGRSIRNDKDWAETYILDSCFDQVLYKAPKYFKDALKIKTFSKK